MKQRLKIIALVGLGLWGLSAGAQGDGGKISRLMEDIRSDNADLAQAATMELAVMGEAGLSALDNLLKTPGNHDREFEILKQIIAKARKSTPVTIHQEKIAVTDVLREISSQSGVGIRLSPQTRLSMQEISLDVEKVPFWELLDSMAGQLNVRIDSKNTGDVSLMSLSYRSPNSKLGGDWVYLYSVDSNQSIQFPAGERSETTVKLLLRVYPDPARFGMLNKSEIRIDKATDDAGGIYTQPPAITEPDGRGPVVFYRYDTAFSTTLTTQKAGGKKLSIRGAVTEYGAATELKKIDIEKAEGRTVELSLGKLAVTKVDQGNPFSITMNVNEEDWPGLKQNVEPFMVTFQTLTPGCIWVEDEEGTRMSLGFTAMGGRITSQFPMTLKLSNPPAGAKKPAKIVFAFPKDLKPVSIPFEIKDIPLP